MKEKRRSIKSLKDIINHKFNVSCAEVDYLDAHQRAKLGIAVVSNEGKHAASVLNAVLGVVRSHRGVELVDYDMEML